MTDRAVVWFRRDLRLHDNPAWSAATAGHAEVLPVFVLDPVLLAGAGPYRGPAVLEAVAGLDATLRGAGGALHVAMGDPRRALPELLGAAGATALYLNRDVTPYATRRDTHVERRVDVPVTGTWGAWVHPPGSIVTGDGHVPRVFTAFWRRWQDRPVPTPADPGTATLVTHSGCEAVPTDGIRTEADAAARLAAFVDGALAGYESGRDQAAGRGTSVLSVDLKTGVIGPATVMRAAATSRHGEPFVRQLAWRDWYAHLLHEDPALVDHAQRPEYDRIRWRDDPEGLAAWQDGRTGVPIVDAGMRQLTATGWMHNRVRMITASFLVKDLLVDWRLGERHFRRLLADGDVPQNVGNWQWIAGTGPDAAPYFRVFNPTRQSRTFDPGGTYLRRWVPELAGLDDQSIHEPAGLGPLELAAAGVALGVDYPFPIVDHGTARERAVAAYKAARTG
ncbi:MAG: cryptochrome/photolyase family protein [Acidimicrobiia bacterium]